MEPWRNQEYGTKNIHPGHRKNIHPDHRGSAINLILTATGKFSFFTLEWHLYRICFSLGHFLTVVSSDQIVWCFKMSKFLSPSLANIILFSILLTEISGFFKLLHHSFKTIHPTRLNLYIANLKRQTICAYWIRDAV
jgi:hypothetical protein